MHSRPDLQLTRVRQQFNAGRIIGVGDHLRARLAEHAQRLTSGERIAIAVGSRGISDLVPIVREVVAFARAAGARPFIVPAMGSHGGGTADGQVAILSGLGVTENSVGAPIESSMDVVELPRADSAVPVYMDRLAAEADGVIVLNRIKPHTSFHGVLESGLGKMCVIGLGKHQGALAMHDQGARGLREHLPAAARAVVASGHIRLGVAVVENALDETMRIEVLEAKSMLDAEPELLKRAKENMPSLPVDDIDVLIVDEIGKDISGVGMDPNIIGRIRIAGEPEPTTPRITSIVVTDLTTGSHGNANGVGLADVITERVRSKIDLGATYANVFTSRFLERAKIPFTAPTAAEAFAVALRACALPQDREPRVVRIKNTLHLQDVYVSANIRSELDGADCCSKSPQPMFAEDGALLPF